MRTQTVSRLVDPTGGPAAEPTLAWWRGGLIYQIYPRSFLDTDGNGIGDLAGITASLGYIADLGVDAIWICPFFPSPMKDFGYDVSDYCAVDPIFGTLADFDRLILEAHRRGLRVLIDQVWSHTSDQHPWFADSRSAPDAAKSDWYVWADPRPDGLPPNNWLAVFGGSAWSWEPRRRQYYLHHFLASQPQLNLRHPAVVQALFAAGRFWLDRGVDGFRLDAVDFMFHDPFFRDNPVRHLPSGSARPMRPFGMQSHVHDMLHPDLLPFFEQVRGLMHEYPGAVTLGEISSEPGAFDRCAIYTDGAASRLDMAYTLDLMKRPLTPASLARTLEEAAAAVGSGCICWSFSNHDVVRAATRWGGPQAGPEFSNMLLALLLALPGSACLYQGEELGLGEATIAPQDMIDPYGLAFYPVFHGRDGARTPMPWHAGAPAAGFTRAERPWLPVDADHVGRAVDRQAQDAGSVLNFTRRYLRWRRAHPALRWGTATVVDLPHPVFGLERAHQGERILCLFNLSPESAAVPRSALPSHRLLQGHGFERSSRHEHDAVILAPYGVLIASVGS